MGLDVGRELNYRNCTVADGTEYLVVIILFQIKTWQHLKILTSKIFQFIHQEATTNNVQQTN